MAEERREVLLLDRARVVVGEAVDAEHVVAVREQARGEVRPDEPRRARDDRLHCSSLRSADGSRRGLPCPSTAACAVKPVASGAASASRRTSYSNATRAPECAATRVLTTSSVVVARRAAVGGARLDHRQVQVLLLELAVGHAALAQQLGAPDLEPGEVAAVPGDAHLVGLGVAHAQAGDGGRAHAAASISPRTARSGIARAERRGAHHHDVGARGHDLGDVPGIDAAVHLQLDREAAGADALAQPPELVERRRQQLLVGEAGVHGHHQHVVELGQDLLERRDRRRGVERHAGRDAALAQVRDRTLQVRHGLDVHADRAWRRRRRRRPGRARRPRSSGVRRAAARWPVGRP